MAKYRIEIGRSAEKALFHIAQKDVTRIISAIQALALNPFPPHSCKLIGQEDVFRIRVGVYRVIYEVIHDVILIKILKIGHRKDVYR